MILENVGLRLAVLVGAFFVLPLLVAQMEHKAMAHMQGRLGPMYAGGFHGWAQLVADGVKFTQKEDIVPARADRGVFALAPALALIPYLVACVAIPVTQAVAAFVFFVAGLAKLQGPPFDMPVADSELVFGPYTAVRFAFFLLAEYAGIVVLCLMTTVLFLGGWRGFFGDSVVWTLAKAAVFAQLVLVTVLRIL